MAASPTPRPTPSNPCTAPLAAWFGEAALAAPTPTAPFAVAYSGGADSTALLLAAHELWPGSVTALHVHHGLQAAADDFESHARATCKRLDILFRVAHVDARNAPGESPEDAARRARYQALAHLAAEAAATDVLLAQHADDQVETLLIALSRGAGLPGLASMPVRFERHRMWFHRPLLQVPALVIREGLADLGETWVDDPSNADDSYTRNRIRHHLMPALEAVFPQFRETFARSARHAAQAERLLRDLALSDLERTDDPPQIAVLREMPRERRANLLRHWLRRTHRAGASAAQMSELLDQIEACATRGHRIELKVGTGQVQRQGDVLAWVQSTPKP